MGQLPALIGLAARLKVAALHPRQEQFPLSHEPLEILLVVEVCHADSRVGHLVDGAVTPDHPLVGVGVVGVVSRVVEVVGDDEHRALGQERHHVVFVEEGRVPTVGPVELVDDLPSPVWVHGLDDLVFSAKMHMPAYAVDPGWPVHHVDALVRGGAVRWDQ